MRCIDKAARISIGVAIFWAALATGVEGQSGVPGGVPVAGGKQEEQRWQAPPCTGCLQEERSTLSPVSLARLSPLPSHGELGERQVGREKISTLAPDLWLKSGDSLLEMVTAKKSLFQESVVSHWRQESLPTSDGFLKLWTW